MVDWSETKFVESTREKCTFGGCGLLGPALDAFTIFFGAPVIFFFGAFVQATCPFKKGSQAKFGDDGEV